MSRQQAANQPQSISISNASGQQMGLLQRKCACGQSPSPTGECADCRRKRGLDIQPKLLVNHPGDRYEQEADRVAEQVSRMPDPVDQQRRAITPVDQAAMARQPQANGSHHADVESPELFAQIKARLGGGQPLDAQTRAYMEPRFGHSFGDVRVHRDPQADALVRQANARAFAVGRDVFFGAGEYQPESAEGRRLAAHELTHVVQQRQSDGSSPGALPVIQRQSADTGDAASPGDAAGARSTHLSRDYVALICEVIADIRRGIEEGHTWYFEDEILLQGEELVSEDLVTDLASKRLAVLQDLVASLDTLIQDLESGAVTPTDPADRSALRDLWRARNPDSHLPHAPSMFTQYVGHRIDASGEYIGLVPAPYRYFDPPDSPPGQVRSAAFPTWWVIGCHAIPPPTRLVRPPLTPGWAIFVSRTGGAVTGWHEEPIRDSYPEALRSFGPYEPQQDEHDGRVYIVVNGQRVYLLPNGRVEPPM